MDGQLTASPKVGCDAPVRERIQDHEGARTMRKLRLAATAAFAVPVLLFASAGISSAAVVHQSSPAVQTHPTLTAMTAAPATPSHVPGAQHISTFSSPTLCSIAATAGTVTGWFEYGTATCDLVIHKQGDEKVDEWELWAIPRV
jgi:hypothetical protein